jgi:hypothetical protein
MKYLQYIDQKANITLTSKGIWELESKLNIINNNALITFIEDKLFDCFKNIRQSLTDKEKVIVFTALAIRAYSKESAIDLTTTNERIIEAWRSIVEAVAEFLYENRIVTTGDIRKELFKDKRHKTALNPVIHFFRYSEFIAKKSNGLFYAKGRKYYLDLYKNNTLNIDDLTFLLGTVLGDKVDSEIIDKVNSFCSDISYGKSVEVYSLSKHIYATPDYDELIRNALRNLIINII